MTSIFLSYSRNDDEAFVRRLYADLTKAGFEVWFDRVSMPSRQLTFHQEIRDAIAARDRLLLVVGPGILTSDYVTQEWRFAYFEAGKCVNPIVRLNGRGAEGVTHASQGIDGYELIPEDLKLLHAEDFRDDAHYDAHLANLIRQLSEAIPPVGKLVAVPELPACFLAQPDRIKALRDLLLVDLQKPVVVSGAAARVGLQGMGGIGKSVLASALAHRPEVRRAFPDGIFWITLGQKPQLAEQQRWLARELGDEALFPDARSGKECLRILLAGRKALLVLDDVWKREDAEAFNVIGAMGRILLTTRDAGLVTALASKETHYRVELPTEAEAEGIFAGAAQIGLDSLPAQAREIVGQCGRLPLALALCGGMVQGGTSPADVLEALREHDLEFLSSDHPAEEQHRNAWKAMDVSLRVLPLEQRDRFAELAVFALDRGAPDAAVVTLWEHTGGLTPRHARKLLADFAARSLVEIPPASDGDPNGARMTLHDLLHNFATGMAEKRFGSRSALHQTLLDAYRKKCPSGWPSGPDDGYFFQNLIEHLLGAGKLDDAVELLIGLSWIEAKSKVKLVFSLQDDYRNTIAAMPEAQEGLSQERERQSRLARWTEEITEYSRQWSERRDQLARGEATTAPEPPLPEPPETCRMWTVPEIESECQRITEIPNRLDRIRAFSRVVEQEYYPLLLLGDRPVFIVQHAFSNAPSGPVHEAAVQALPNAEAPLLMRHWFVIDQYNPKPAQLRTVEVHSERVYRLAATPDGRRAVSSCMDGMLQSWDLETGTCLGYVQTSPGTEVSITPDGKYLVSAHRDNTLRVWDLEKGICIRDLEGPPEYLEGYIYWINDVGITPNGRCVVSASIGNTLRVRDLETGTCLRVLEGHTDGVNSVSVTADGLRVVSASNDTTLRLWNLETGLCLRVLEGHTDHVNSVSVTADGLCAVSASDDTTLRVWDLETGVCLQVLRGPTECLNELSNFVFGVSVTPDGRCAVSASRDDRLRVWDLGTGMCIRELEGDTQIVSVTPDGRYAVSDNSDNTLRVWDLEMGTCIRVLEGHTSYVRSVSVTPDGNCVVSASADHTLRIWELKTGRCLRALEGHSDSVLCVSVTRDGRRAVSGSRDGALRAWNLGTGMCIRELEGQTDYVALNNSANCVSVTPDGRRAVSGSNDSMVRVWDLGTGICIRMLEGHTNAVLGVDVTPDGRYAVSNSRDETTRVWDLDTGKCIRVLDANTKSLEGISEMPDGLRVILTDSEKTLRVWNLKTGKCLRIMGDHADSLYCGEITPDGKRAVFARWSDNSLQVWDLEAGSRLRVLEGHTGSINSLKVTADGRRATSASDDRTLRVWDLETGICLPPSERHADFVWEISVIPEGSNAVSAGMDKTLRVWDLRTGICLRMLEGHPDFVASVSVLPDGNHAISSSQDEADGSWRVWDVRTGVCLRVLAGRKGGLFGLAVTPDGRLVVSQSGRSRLEVGVWDLETGNCLRLLKGHTGEVKDVSVTLDGFRAVSASEDHTLRAWDLETGRCLRVLEGHTDSVIAVAVTPDGKCAVSTSMDQTLRVWNLETGECIEVLRDDVVFGCVRVTPDGRSLLSAPWDKTVRIWDLKTLAPLAVARMPSNVTFTISPSLNCVIVGTHGGEVLRFDLHGIIMTAN